MISAVANRAVAIKLMDSLRRLELKKIIRIISEKNLNLLVNKYNVTFHSAN